MALAEIDVSEAEHRIPFAGTVLRAGEVESPDHDKLAQEREEREERWERKEDELAPLSFFARTIYEQKYAWKDEDGNVVEDWPDTAERVVFHVMGALGYGPGSYEYDRLLELVKQRKFMPGGRYLYAAGRELNQTQNCVLYNCEDSREGWADLLRKGAMSLQTGAGIGSVYNDVRPYGTPIKKTGGIASGPSSPAQMVNEIGRHIMQGGTRRSAIWGGLIWSHPDIFSWIRLKDYPEAIRLLKEEDPDFPAPMDKTNISVILDDAFFDAMDGANVTVQYPWDKQESLFAPDGRTWQDWAEDVYWTVIKKMTKTGEPGFSIDTGENAGEHLRNACTEITSRDDSDICNLGSVNLGRIESVEEFSEAVELGTLFLLAGTVYSSVPHEEIEDTRQKNRRLGLGLMGFHEWLIKRGYSYEVVPELHEWLAEYRDISDRASDFYADKHGLSRPIKKRGIAPNGTIAAVAETTSSVECIIFVAMIRRYIEGGDVYKFQYVVDPVARKMVDKHGVDPNDIQDSYILALNPEVRIKFQADVQAYVDHAISSTVNLPHPFTEEWEWRDFGEMLLPYLPKLRGVTVYPSGARGGQPMTWVPYEEAIGKEGVVFESEAELCQGGSCSI
jgi:ribonucleoside-diphosphate reductase alpha chain